MPPGPCPPSGRGRRLPSEAVAHGVPFGAELAEQATLTGAPLVRTSRTGPRILQPRSRARSTVPMAAVVLPLPSPVLTRTIDGPFRVAGFGAFGWRDVSGGCGSAVMKPSSVVRTRHCVAAPGTTMGRKARPTPRRQRRRAARCCPGQTSRAALTGPPGPPPGRADGRSTARPGSSRDGAQYAKPFSRRSSSVSSRTSGRGRGRAKSVGSSITSTGASCTRARASTARWHSPAGEPAQRAVGEGGQSSRSSTAAATRRSCAVSLPGRSGGPSGPAARSR